MTMKITLVTSEGTLCGNASTWDNANAIAKAFLKRDLGSDLYYEIDFGTEKASGVIDMEPRSFHQSHINSIVTNHLKVWWGNVSRHNKPFPHITPEFKEKCKRLLTFLPQ